MWNLGSDREWCMYFPVKENNQDVVSWRQMREEYSNTWVMLPLHPLAGYKKSSPHWEFFFWKRWVSSIQEIWKCSCWVWRVFQVSQSPMAKAVRTVKQKQAPPCNGMGFLCLSQGQVRRSVGVVSGMCSMGLIKFLFPLSNKISLQHFCASPELLQMPVFKGL